MTPALAFAWLRFCSFTLDHLRQGRQRGWFQWSLMPLKSSLHLQATLSSTAIKPIPWRCNKEVWCLQLHDDKYHNHPLMIKASTLLSLMWSEVVILYCFMTDPLTLNTSVAGFRPLTGFSPPMWSVKALFNAYIQFSQGRRCDAVCAGCAACADVCGLCLWWLHGPRIACFGLECDLTHTHIHTQREERESSSH